MPHTSLTDYGILSSGHAEAMWNKASKLLNDHKIIKAPDIGIQKQDGFLVIRDYHLML